jgi:hypothetical protein
VITRGPDLQSGVAARVQAVMSDIFQEVDEEVRRDRAVAFWNKYQNFILGAAVVIVLGVGGYRLWDYNRTRAAEAAGAAFQSAIRLDAEGKSDEAQAALDALQKQAPRGYAGLTRFVEAGVAARKDPKAGAAAYDALAQDSALDPLLRDTAKLRAALARLDAGEVDTAKASLESLADSPYRNTARLTLGSLALAGKDFPAAGKLFGEVIGDAEAPQAERKMAEQLLGLVAAQGAKPKS